MKTTPFIHKYDGADAWWDEQVINLIKDSYKIRALRHIDSESENLKGQHLKEYVAKALPDATVHNYYSTNVEGLRILLSEPGFLMEFYTNSNTVTRAIVSIFADSLELAENAYSKLASVVPKRERVNEDTVTFDVWRLNQDGPMSSSRKIFCPTLEDILPNYTEDTQKALKEIAGMKNPYEKGKVIMWRGVPGSGKTHAVRSLARCWAKDLNASIELVMDPEKLLDNSGYLQNLILSDPNEDVHNEEDKKKGPRLIVIEDAAEMFMKGAARAQAGFSRLLNVTDGIIGQGLKTIFLLTANEEIEQIDDALLRSGRCLQTLEFELIPREQAREWLKAKGGDPNRVEEDTALADLYAILNGHSPVAEERGRVGF